jgi:hypothetical protein
MPTTYVPREDPLLKWGPFTDPTPIPRSRAEVYRIFGDPRLRGADGKPVGKVDPAWVKKNLVEFQGKNALPGVPPKWYFNCHRLIAPRMREGLRRAQVAAPDYRIKRAACFNYRHIRHDTPAKAKKENRPLRDLSLHAVAIAIDIDAPDNQAVEFKRREDVPDFWSPEWMEIWPRGLPREFVDAMISVGFKWGGDWDRDWNAQDQLFVDPQHWELTA